MSGQRYLGRKSRSKRPSQNLTNLIAEATQKFSGAERGKYDAMTAELYRLSARKVAEAGYPVTRDRVWDQFVSIAVRSGLRELLKPHRSQIYLSN